MSLLGQWFWTGRGHWVINSGFFRVKVQASTSKRIASCFRKTQQHGVLRTEHVLSLLFFPEIKSEVVMSKQNRLGPKSYVLKLRKDFTAWPANVKETLSEIRFADINECFSSSHGCSNNARCTNIRGNYSCTCNKKFTGDGRSCTSKFNLDTCVPLMGRSWTHYSDKW